MRIRLLSAWAVPCSAAALVPLVALAHHGWAGQGEERFELTGVVHEPVSLENPHATMRIADSDGRIWDLTLAPPARTSRAGLEEGLLQVGDEVTISGRRSRDPERLEVKTERVTWNGRDFDVYAGRR